MLPTKLAATIRHSAFAFTNNISVRQLSSIDGVDYLANA